MDRKTFYKHAASDVTELREKKREEETVLRRQKREKLVLSKRVRHSEEDLALVDSSFTVKQVEDIGNLIKEESNDRISLLKQLKDAFAEDIVNIDVFLSVNGALHSLIGLLTGNDAGLQLEASWCLTNLAAGNQHHSSLALKHAAPYLITFLQGHNAPLQDQCCWALGNIAGDGPEFREILIKQGAIHPLICLLQSPVPRVVQSAAFAISNFIREPDADVSVLVSAGIAPMLLQHVNAETDNLPVLAEIAWVLMYAMASGEFEEAFTSHDAISKIVAVASQLASTEVQNVQALTPLIRCLGNLCSGAIHNTKMVTQNGCLLTAFPFLLNSPHRHIRKESLWLLSNILVDVDVCRMVAKIPDLMSYIVQRCAETFDIQKEALVCLCNLAYSGSDNCHPLLQHGAIPAVVAFLKSPDPELLTGALNFSSMMLIHCEMSRKAFEEEGGVDHLEALANHTIHIIQELAHNMLDRYFSDTQMEACDEGS